LKNSGGNEPCYQKCTRATGGVRTDAGTDPTVEGLLDSFLISSRGHSKRVEQCSVSSHTSDVCVVL